MKMKWGQLIEPLGGGAVGTACLVRLGSGALAVEKHANSSDEELRSLLRGEGRLCAFYRGAQEFIQMIAACFDDEPALLFEYADGRSLRDRIKKHGRQSEADVRAMLVVTMSGLIKMRANGHVHRDLKPENIFIKEGQFKLGDLGHAHGAPRTVGTYPRAGTKAYQAPESKRGLATTASDVYSLGIVGQEMLLGRRKGPGTVRSARSDVSSALVGLLELMRSPNPAARPTPEQVLAILDGAKDLDPNPSPPAPEKQIDWGKVGVYGLIVLGIVIAGLFLVRWLQRK